MPDLSSNAPLDPITLWCCPACKQELSVIETAVACSNCGVHYDVIEGIPDLRIPATDKNAARLADVTLARRLARDAPEKTVEQLVHEFFAAREGSDGWTSEHSDKRTKGTLAAIAILGTEINGWLGPVIERGTFLDVGCGLGGLLSAAAQFGSAGIGIDNRMAVLVIARKIIEQHGGTAKLACADAEAIPLSDNSVDGVVMYDVVEHVNRLDVVLGEVNRVTRLGGRFACSTPNRFSLAPEPHVGILGVGWVPRSFQSTYVRKLSGRDYSGTRLVSVSELEAILTKSTSFDFRPSLPPISDSDIATASGLRRVLAKAYNVLAGQHVFRGILLRIGPFFRMVGVKAKR